MRFRPVTPDALVGEVAELVIAREGRVRVAVDGAPPTRPGDLADAVAAVLRERGRPVLRVSAADFSRPASLRYEHGRTDALSRLDRWLDDGALRREVLDRADGRALPTYWDTRTDRATRAGYVDLAPDAVVLLDGELLMGRGLPLDLVVHLWLSAPALARTTPPDEHWALEAFATYDTRARPLHLADVGVRVDDPRRPAVLDDAPV